jgi:isocitrate dehydrogenase (NAD+)
MQTVLEATGIQFEWILAEAGVDVIEKYGTPLPPQVLDSIRDTTVAIKGPIGTPIGTGFRSVNVAIRKELDLYANLRPAKSLVGVKSFFENIDLVIVRENTEDLYAGIEFERGTEKAKALQDYLTTLSDKPIPPGSALGIKPISEQGSRRIVKFAFEYARTNQRRKVTAVHKANIMKFTDGLFLEVAREVAQEYPEIEFDDRIVDNMCMQLMQKPQLYDVLVLPNLYGDILSDLCAGMIGGLGVAPGANIGEGIAVFEAIHGSAPKYAGQNKVNPVALILTGSLMLNYLGEREAARKVDQAVQKIIAEGKQVTYDLTEGTPVGTQEMAEAIAQEVASGA